MSKKSCIVSGNADAWKSNVIFQAVREENEPNE